MVIDTSVILAIYFNEPYAQWASTHLNRADRRIMSTINMTECLIKFRDIKGAAVANFESRLESSDILFVAPDVSHCRLAAYARFRFPLNFGDCFAYALARTENLPLLTLDRDFISTDITVVHPSNQSK